MRECEGAYALMPSIVGLEEDESMREGVVMTYWLTR